MANLAEDATDKEIRSYVARNPWKPGLIGKGFISGSGSVIWWALDDVAQRCKDTDGHPYHADVAIALRANIDRGQFYLGVRGALYFYGEQAYEDKSDLPPPGDKERVKAKITKLKADIKAAKKAKKR